MLLGTREPFDYRTCRHCGCIQIEAVPDDLAPYYPASSYYALGDQPTWPWTMPIAEILDVALAQATSIVASGDPAALAALAERALQFYLPKVTFPKSARILDVGCGNGGFIAALTQAGFERCQGVDPFAPDSAFQVTRSTLEAFAPRRKWDVIMMHHSFEHVPAPRATLEAAAKRLAKGGLLLLRMPVAGSPACEAYGRDWSLLDAPRHLFIQSRDSVDRLAAKAGLQVADIVFDGTGFQFWGSEQNRQDIAFMEPRSVVVSPFRSPFSTAQLTGWDAEARRRNRAGEGDQAGFVLSR